MSAESEARILGSARRLTVHSAHFDFGIVSIGIGGGTSDSFSGTMALLAKGLATSNARTVAIEARDSLNPILCAASKLICFEDRLFEREDGAEHTQFCVSTARRAGRMTGLVCTSLSTVFSHRRRIMETFGGNPDFVVGESAAVLSLFGLSRIDTLIPRMLFTDGGLALHRTGHPPIFVPPGTDSFVSGDIPISRETFWSGFVPDALDGFLARATVDCGTNRQSHKIPVHKLPF